MPNDKDVISSAIKHSLTYLRGKQRADGSFNSYSFQDLTDKKNFKTNQTTFFTSLITQILTQLPKSDDTKLITDHAVKFLLAERSQNWSWNYWSKNSQQAKLTPYPNDLDDTFNALCALLLYNKKYIAGDVLARVVLLLTELEQREGGPYYTWLVKDATSQWKDVDIAANSNIAFFLSLQNISLKNVIDFVESCIRAGSLKSPYYASTYPVIYFISRFYTGVYKEDVIALLLNAAENGYWENPLDTALVVSSLLNFGCSVDKVESGISYILKEQKNFHWKTYPFVIEYMSRDSIYSGSDEITTAFCIESLQKYVNAVPGYTKTTISSLHENIYQEIMTGVNKKIANLDPLLRNDAQDIMITFAYNNKEVITMPAFFARCVQKKNKALTKEIRTKLGMLTLFGWVAYSIYDDFLDERGNQVLLPVANISYRELNNIIYELVSPHTGMREIIEKIMVGIEEANFWELMNCRFSPENKIDISKLPIPDYGDYRFVAQKSLGHCIGALIILNKLGYKYSSPVIQHVHTFFKHYLIARQINDDAHDWKEDLVNGQINTVSFILLKKLREKKSKKQRYSPTELAVVLREIFWLETVPDVCDIVQVHIQVAHDAIQKSDVIDSQFAALLLQPLERSIESARAEQKNAFSFIKKYQQRKASTHKSMVE